MAKARFLSSALDGQTVTMSATQGGATVGPNTISAWKQPDTEWNGVGPASLTVTVDEILPTGTHFAPLPVEWRIRVTGTSYDTPNWAPPGPGAPNYYANMPPAQESAYRLALEALDPSFQRCQFVVHTGDTGNYRNTWLGSAAHRNKAYQYGQNPGHVYDTPGTYNRSIYVYDDEGNWGTLTLNPLVIESPDTVFDAASTIVVSPTSDWTGAPAHDVANRCTTIDAAADRHNQIREGLAGGVRICIQAGATFNERSRSFDSRFSNGVNLIDTYGGSDRFTYSEAGLNTPVSGTELIFGNDQGFAWRICNGVFDMGYDVGQGRPTNPDGWLGGANTLNRSLFRQDDPGGIFFDGIGDPIYRTVFHNCDITGCGFFALWVQTVNIINARDNAWFLNDVDFYDNADYSCFVPHSLFALGCRQYESAVGGRDIGGQQRSATMGTSRGWSGHPIFVRETTMFTLYVRATYLENRGGWSGGGFFAFRGSQPTMRLRNASETSFTVQADGWMNGRGRRMFICDSVINGAFNLGIGNAELATNDPTQSVDFGHAVVETCVLIHDLQGPDNIISRFQGRHSIRNCVFLSLESPDLSLNAANNPGRDLTRFTNIDNSNGRFDHFIDTTGNISKIGDLAEIRHNTYIMLRTTSEIRDGDWTTRAPSWGWNDTDYNLVEGHNVVSAPRLTVPEGLSEAQLEKITLPAGMRILDAWIKFYWERADYTLASAVPAGQETPALQYPVDWYTNATTGADYEDSGRNNAINTSVGRFYEPPNNYPNSNNVQAQKENAGLMTVIHDCNAAGVVQGDGTGTHFKIENNSTVEWPAGNLEVILDRSGSGQMAEEVLTNVDQADFALYRPVTPQALDVGLASTLWDFNRSRRPNAGYAISPSSGANAAGALLPA